MSSLIRLLALLSLLLTSALFGFFYAWVCSTMWGLDAADPRVAIAAMQAMNASVRNAIFAPAFFGTSIALLMTTIALWRAANRPAAVWFGTATVLVTVLGVVLTMAVNVPMNQALAHQTVPQEITTARAIWLEYSPNWQFWNQIRTIATGFAVLCVGVGFLKFSRPLV
ncbi:MAG: anthrone oxygenase family protein [Sulfitobacter sp.]